MTDAIEQAIGQVQEAMDRVVAAREAEHPKVPRDTRAPRPPAWHPDRHQPPVTTRRWAEVTRLRAEHLRQQGLQTYEQAQQVHQATQALLALLRRPPEDHDPGEFTRVNPTTALVPSTPRRHR